MSPALAKLVRVFIVAAFAFLLADNSLRLSDACGQATGGAWAWAGLTLSIIGLSFGTFLVVRDGRNPGR